MKTIRFISISVMMCIIVLGLTMCIKSDESANSACKDSCAVGAVIRDIMTRTSSVTILTRA